MTRAVELVPLQCTHCQAPVPAQDGEVAWVCAQCGQGLLLADDGLQGIEARFAEGIAPDSSGRPFWVSEGKLDLLERESYEHVGLLGRGDQGSAARDFWGSARIFFVPAYTCELEALVETGERLLREPPPLRAGSRHAMLPVTTGPEDVQALAEFIAMNIEIDRSDTLREFNVSLKLQPPVLWVLP